MNPLSTIKIIAGALIVLLLFCGGWACGSSRSSKALIKCSTAHLHAVATSQKMFRTIEATTKATKDAAREAEKRIRIADQAVKEAVSDRLEYEKRLSEINDSVDKGMRDPGCRARLEEAVCVPLH